VTEHGGPAGGTGLFSSEGEDRQLLSGAKMTSSKFGAAARQA